MVDVGCVCVLDRRGRAVAESVCGKVWPCAAWWWCCCTCTSVCICVRYVKSEVASVLYAIVGVGVRLTFHAVVPLVSVWRMWTLRSHVQPSPACACAHRPVHRSRTPCFATVSTRYWLHAQGLHVQSDSSDARRQCSSGNARLALPCPPLEHLQRIERPHCGPFHTPHIPPPSRPCLQFTCS